VNPYSDHSFHLLGDSCVVLQFANAITVTTNQKVLTLFQSILSANLPFIKDVIPAYNSLAVHYDVYAVKQQFPDQSAFAVVSETLEAILAKEKDQQNFESRKLKIPVCYTPLFALDLNELAQQRNISQQDIIQLHTSSTYRVYMLGFLPGFAYMGEVDEKLATPRKASPRTVVPEGSVGIASTQTGIYPLASPGGWNIIGRTPLKLFDKDKEDPCLFQPGDEVTFYSITEDEFAHYQSRTV
jgi:inhibitor of KinA